MDCSIWCILLFRFYLLKQDRHLPFFTYALSYEDIININGTENSHADDMHDIILMIIYQIFTITRNEGQDVRHQDQKVVCVGESLMFIGTELQNHPSSTAYWGQMRRLEMECECDDLMTPWLDVYG